MNIAVFGANGQLGRCFRDVSRESTLCYTFYNKDQFDISDPFSFTELNPPDIDVLINCAAYTAVDQAEEDRSTADRINVTGAKMLADFGVLHNIPLIHFSTDYVYGSAREPISEDQKINPVNYYGQSKWNGEEEIRKSGVSHLIIRTSWLYSEYGHNFVKTMLRLAIQNDKIKVVHDQTGSPTYAQDLARAVDQILRSADDDLELPWGIYNFANHGAITWHRFAVEILKDKAVLVKPIPTSDYPTPAVRPAYSVLDPSKFEHAFGIDIPQWQESLERCMEKI